MIAVKRTFPGPIDELNSEKSKASGTYRLAPVVEQLRSDFFNKCYLCEQKGPTSINIEHLQPHRGTDRDLEFSWANLFWACGHCNGTKGDRYHPILDCTEANMRVLGRLDFEFERFPTPQVTINGLDNSNETLNTANLLAAIHNGSTTALIRQMEAENLCSLILDEFNRFIRLLERHEESEGDDKELYSRRIVRSLSPEAPFTAIKACYVKRHPRLREEFGSAIQNL